MGVATMIFQRPSSGWRRFFRFLQCQIWEPLTARNLPFTIGLNVCPAPVGGDTAEQASDPGTGGWGEGCASDAEP